MIQLSQRTDGQTGIQSLLGQRANFASRSHLKTLLNHGSNREAIAIVESFQNQMVVELNADKFDVSPN